MLFPVKFMVGIFEAQLLAKYSWLKLKKQKHVFYSDCFHGVIVFSANKTPVIFSIKKRQYIYNE